MSAQLQIHGGNRFLCRRSALESTRRGCEQAAMSAVLDPRFDVTSHVRRIEEDGFTILPDFLDADDLTEVRRVLSRYEGTHAGRNDFEGTRTERIYTLVARGRVFWRIALDPRVLALCEHFLEPG